MDHKTRIIVAEDDLLVAWTVRLGLLDRGYEVCGWADNAPEAVRLAELHRPDVAVLDMAVLDVGLSDGTDGMAAAREISDRLGIPVVICSSHSGTFGRLQMEIAGWVPKPCRISDLDRSISAAVRH